MAYMHEIVRELLKDKRPDSDAAFRRVALKLNTNFHDVKQIYLKFRDSIDLVTGLRNELQITTAERDGLKSANQMLEHERSKLTALPTKAEWTRADRISLFKMNYLEGDEMTVADYHTLMGK